jgi:segregation and condensation protein B
MHISKESIDEIDKSIEAEHIKKVEAALFRAGKFMSIQELVALTDVNPIILKKILEDLSYKYKDSGIDILNKNNLWKMDVAQECMWMVNRLAAGSSEFTKAEQETLALIAYKQPMKQSVVVKIRGNKAYEHVKKFAELGLINKKKMGHTAELTLNESFFDYFNLAGKEDENTFEIVKKARETEAATGEAGKTGDVTKEGNSP